MVDNFSYKPSENKKKKRKTFGSVAFIALAALISILFVSASYSRPPEWAKGKQHCGYANFPPCPTPTPSPTISPSPTPSPSTSPSPSPSPTTSPPTDAQPTFPIRAAFYYPWFPETWGNLSSPNTHYNPTLGFYNSSNTSIVQNHIANMLYGGIQAGISSWWGQGTQTDQRVPILLRGADNTTFRWTLYYEPEGYSNPTSSQISNDLQYIKTNYGNDPNFLRVNGRFVVFVYADANDACGMADRWKAGNTINAFIVLKVFSGYTNCAPQPDSWHQYGPASATQSHLPYSYAISPGYWHYNSGSPLLSRDLNRWNSNIRSMISSNANWQLVTTFNEWGEGTSVESATQWGNAYLDALRNNGAVSPTPTPTISPTLSPSPTTSPSPSPTTSPGLYPVIAAAGDIACGSSSTSSTTCHQLQTSDLLINKGYSAVLTLGDNQYETGALSAFQTYYAPTWGRVFSITKPAPGNHEYGTSGATGYFSYFGVPSYYSYDIGSWHFLSINSNCSSIGGCGLGSAQDNWVKVDLAAHSNTCTLAYWHHPRFSSGEHGNQTVMDTIWKSLVTGGADVVLNGHDHDYERFANMDGNGNANQNGIKEFVVGTGGKSHYVVTPTANSVVSNDNTFGVLEMTLQPTSYSWVFRAEAGKTFTDSGSAVCH